MNLTKANKKRRRQILADAILNFERYDHNYEHKCAVGIGFKLMGSRPMWVGFQELTDFGKFFGMTVNQADDLYKGWFEGGSRYRTTKEQAAEYVRSL